MGNALTIEDDHEINKSNAKKLESDAQFEASQRRKVAERLMGEQAAAFGANGVEITGSAAQMMIADRAEAEIEAMNIIYSGKYSSADLRRRSENQRLNAYTGLAVRAGMAYATGGASEGFQAASGAGGMGASSSNGGAGYYSGSNTGKSTSGNLA